MTKAGEQRLRLFSIVLLISMLVFTLESGAAPGWKTGVAFLMMSVLCAIDFCREKGKFYRLPYAVFGLFFLFLTFKNFLAH